MSETHDRPSIIENVLAIVGILLVVGSIAYLFACHDGQPTARGWGIHEPGYFATGSTTID